MYASVCGVLAISVFVLKGFRYEIIWRLLISPIMSIWYFFFRHKALEDVPVQAYKYWFLSYNRTYNKPQLVPITMRTRYTKVADKAICFAKGSNHIEVPGDNCVCGFYGMRYKWLIRCNPTCAPYATSRLDSVLLVVEFYGKLLESTAGYRAQHQRILQIRLKKRCSVNGCWRSTKYAVLGRKTSVKFPRSESLYAVCKKHKNDETGDAIDPCYSLSDLANSFGTEVTLR